MKKTCDKLKRGNFKQQPWGVFLCWVIVCSSCVSSQNNCERKKEVDSSTTTTSEMKVSDEMKSKMEGQVEKVRVFKFDGTKQCENNPPIDINSFKKELEALQILVYKEEKSVPSGLLVMTMCGAPTGMAHVFTIAKKDLDVALKNGFRLMSE